MNKKSHPPGNLLLEVGTKAFAWLRKKSPVDEARPLSVSCDELELAILGPELAGNPRLESDRQQLVTGFLSGQAAARTLVGWLLVFQASSHGKWPGLLRDIGEAYYGWQPRTSGEAAPLENALVAWLHRLFRQAGLPHTIELTNPGERFDASRHHSTEPGVEVTEVRGWIVLRDTDKVFAKATVVVK